MAKKGQALGLFNMRGSRDSKKILSHQMNPFGGYAFMMELLGNTDFNTIEFLGETFDLKTQLEEVKIYLSRFFEVVKFDYTRENRPLLRLKYYLEEKKYEILFITDSPLIGVDVEEYIKELENEIQQLKLKYENN